VNGRPHERFLRAVYIRLIFIRAVEHLGVCILAGCAIALPLLPILLWREQPILLPGIFLGLLVLFGAVALTFHRWPSIFQAAAEADQQLELADLLTTALQLESVTSDVMISPMLAMADARSEQFSPSAVVLNRFGVRAWGGIVLSVMTVFAISLFPAHPMRSASANASNSPLMDASGSHDEARVAKAAGSPHNDPSSDESNRTMRMDRVAENSLPKTMNSPVGGTDSSQGGGVQTKLQQDQSTGSAAGASGPLADHGTANSAFAGSSSSVHTIPPSQMSDWPKARQAATLDLAGDKIPANDRDLVRDYFDHN
jgi:hypothetical protein